ncbi:hypothetical protein ACFW91_23690 [Streptomyces asoensis]|uniref:hypothetical protein n=1 Tax=Streptomyces TaxID=1883 RepID=UPI0027DB42DC|nr:hypothetical protein [Streptomyces sp. MBT97]
MTVTEDRITMAEESDELSLDVMFEWLEKMPVPEGTKVEIVGGNLTGTVVGLVVRTDEFPRD